MCTELHPLRPIFIHKWPNQAEFQDSSIRIRHEERIIRLLNIIHIHIHLANQSNNITSKSNWYLQLGCRVAMIIL